VAAVMAIERKTVEHVAQLARLKLSPEELDRFQGQLGAILDYVSQLEKVDIAGLEPLAQAVDTFNVMRDDVPGPSLPHAEALRNAPERTDDFFVVPKVVE
jgi:aspartyl-tRNA(Asn)/glutamyl-tRNA(Gln) amidotransferase subunit C